MRGLFILFLLSFSLHLTAQSTDSLLSEAADISEVIDISTDSLAVPLEDTLALFFEPSVLETIDERNWSDEDFDDFRGAAFNYTPREPGGGIGTLLAWLASLFPSQTGGTATQWRILEALFYLVCVGLLVYAIFTALGLSTTRIFRRAEKSILEYEVEEADISQLDFNQLIKEALKKKDYRLAIRYHYLQALDTLSRAGLIDWQYHKTNRDYLYELYSSKHRGEFSRLTDLFEHIWYGAIDLKKDQFESTANQFSKFKSRFSRK